MSAKLFITIDTEEDLWDDWKSKDNPVENVTRIPIIQNLLDRYKAVPTYLINYPVVVNERARRIIQEIYDSGRCEIGTHLHPWNTPPFEENISGYNTMLYNLPYELQYRKIKMLHEEIVCRLGTVPICFRAGRWGFGPSVARCIREIGYKIDTSITPFVNWTNEGGPDFSDASPFPYRFDPGDVLSENSGGHILEVPVTIGFLQKNVKRCARVRKYIQNGPFSQFHFLGCLDRLKILNLRWLSPELNNGEEMIRLAKTFIRLGRSSLNMVFHSTSLLPGNSPFVRNEHELKRFFKNIEMFLQFGQDNGLIFLPLSGVLEDFNGRR